MIDQSEQRPVTSVSFTLQKHGAHNLSLTMSRRREKRNFLALPVRALRSDASGRGSRQIVCTLDLSAQGARVIGLPEIQVGQEVTLEHNNNRVRFQAVWVGQPGTARLGQVGLRSLDPEKKLAVIDELLVGDYVDTWSPKQLGLDDIQADRRSVQRFDCDRGATYWIDDASSPTTGRLDNVSLNGCCISTRFPLPRRTRLNMTLSLYGMKISTKGEVRTCWGEGMGVMFTVLDRDSELRLKKAVQRLRQGSSSIDQSPRVQSEGREAEQILEDVRAWFDRNLKMSWEEFFDIQVRSKGTLVSASVDPDF